jgi:hypothetical protein
VEGPAVSIPVLTHPLNPVPFTEKTYFTSFFCCGASPQIPGAIHKPGSRENPLAEALGYDDNVEMPLKSFCV